MVDRDGRSRSCHIEVVPDDRDPPLLTIPHKELAHHAKGQNSFAVRDRLVIFWIAVEALFDLLPDTHVCGWT